MIQNGNIYICVCVLKWKLIVKYLKTVTQEPRFWVKNAKPRARRCCTSFLHCPKAFLSL